MIQYYYNNQIKEIKMNAGEKGAPSGASWSAPTGTPPANQARKKPCIGGGSVQRKEKRRQRLINEGKGIYNETCQKNEAFKRQTTIQGGGTGPATQMFMGIIKVLDLKKSDPKDEETVLDTFIKEREQRGTIYELTKKIQIINPKTKKEQTLSNLVIAIQKECSIVNVLDPILIENEKKESSIEQRQQLQQPAAATSGRRQKQPEWVGADRQGEMRRKQMAAWRLQQQQQQQQQLAAAVYPQQPAASAAWPAAAYPQQPAAYQLPPAAYQLPPAAYQLPPAAYPQQPAAAAYPPPPAYQPPPAAYQPPPAAYQPPWQQQQQAASAPPLDPFETMAAQVAAGASAAGGGGFIPPPPQQQAAGATAGGGFLPAYQQQQWQPPAAGGGADGAMDTPLTPEEIEALMKKDPQPQEGEGDLGDLGDLGDFYNLDFSGGNPLN